MVDQELIGGIRCVASKRQISELLSNDASVILSRVKNNLIDSSPGIWWWEFIRDEYVVIQYGEGDELSMLSDLVGNFVPVLLVPTDDETPPWPVFSGRMDRIVDLLKELRIFEYFITDMDQSWAVFDTHHNSLIVAGRLIEKAKELKEILS